MFKKSSKLNIDEVTLKIYNNLSTVCGIFSIILTPTGLFGIIVGFIGLCLSVTYYTLTKRLRIGYILCIIGSLLSAVFLVLQLCLVYGVHPY